MSDLISAYKLLHQGTLALSRAEQQGIRVDVELCQHEINRLERRINQFDRRFRRSDLAKEWGKTFKSKTNYTSDHQLRTVLYDVLNIKPTKMTEGGKGSTDEEALRQIGITELDYLLRKRKLEKLIGTYLKGFLREQVDGYLHPSFMLHTVVTFRSSSADPNLQNIPKRDKEALQITRSVLFPRPGHILLEIDFSGLEVCISCCYHKDPEMLRYLHDPSSDMHADQAYIIFILNDYDHLIKKAGFKRISEFYTLRQAAKNGFVFPEFYGDYYGNCASSLACGWGKLPSGKWSHGQGVPMPNGGTLSDHLIKHNIRSLEKFTKHVEDTEYKFWNERFKVYNRWRKQWYADYQEKGYFDMTTGFRCQGVMRRNDAINYPVQGAAFHCLLWTLNKVDGIIQKERLDSRIIGEVHDSMLIDAHPEELEHVVETVRKVACEELPKAWPWIIVPLSVEVEAAPIDRPWSEIKPLQV